MDLSTLNAYVLRGQPLLLALSGGLDSICLLHFLVTALGATRTQTLTCLHVDHGLDPQSSERAVEAERLAVTLGLTCHVQRLTDPPISNREAWARASRYAFFQTQMTPGAVLITAHHADDVAETLILRMLRGSGIAGLAGIQSQQSFGVGTLWRPLLEWSRDDLVAYATRNALSWVDDPSNASLDYDRNYIRHKIMPLLKVRFAGAQAALNRSARLNKEAATLLEDVVKERVNRRLRSHFRLSLDGFEQMSVFEQTELIRHWCLSLAVTPPPGKRLDAFADQVRKAHRDRTPTLAWGNAKIYRYHDYLWLVATEASQPRTAYQLDWEPGQRLSLPHALGTLDLDLSSVDPSLVEEMRLTGLTVRSGGPDERIQLKMNGPERTLARRLSQAHIPPWERDLWPRLWMNKTLLACGQRWQHPLLNHSLTWSTNCFQGMADPLE